MRLKKRIVGLGLAMSLMLSGLYAAPEKVRAEVENKNTQKVESISVVASKQMYGREGYYKAIKIADDKKGTIITAEISRDFKKVKFSGKNNTGRDLGLGFDIDTGANGSFTMEGQNEYISTYTIKASEKKFEFARNLIWNKSGAYIDTYSVGTILNYLLGNYRKPEYSIVYYLERYDDTKTNAYGISNLVKNRWVVGGASPEPGTFTNKVSFLSRKEFHKISKRKIKLDKGDKIKLVIKEDIISDKKGKYKSGLTILKDSWWDSSSNESKKLTWTPDYAGTLTDYTITPFEIEEKRHPIHKKAKDYSRAQLNWYSAKESYKTFVKEVTDSTDNFSMKVKYRFADRKRRGISGFSAILYKNDEKFADIWLDDFYSNDELLGKKASKQKTWNIFQYSAEDNTISFKAFDVTD